MPHAWCSMHALCPPPVPRVPRVPVLGCQAVFAPLPLADCVCCCRAVVAGIHHP
jgi:hypothetical protein